MATLRNIHIPSTTVRTFPPNVGIGLPHGSSWVPEPFYSRLNPDLRANNDLLLSNFSDEGTTALIPTYVPREQVVFARASRAVGDPNRPSDHPDLFAEKDFNKVPVWQEPPTPEEKAELVRLYYDPYHAQVQALLAHLEAREPQGKFIYFDLHDTGNCLMRPAPEPHDTRTPAFPAMCLSYRGGKTCAPDIFQAFVSLVTRYTGITPQIDDPYEGGYNILCYGEQYNAGRLPEARFRRNCIQIEIGRFLYVDEATQTLRIDDTVRLREALMQAICELGFQYAG